MDVFKLILPRFLLQYWPVIRRCGSMGFRNLLIFYCTYYLLSYFIRSSTQQESLLVIRGRNPSRLFPPGSPVKDYFYGETRGLARAVHRNDITVVFLYAPWCIFSIAAKAEFEQVAQELKGQVAFLAINCAWDAGECAKRRRPEHFPLIGAYVGASRRLFITFRGVAKADHLKIFVESLLKPYSLISTENHFQIFIHTHEIAVVGVVPLTGKDRSALQTFFNTSLLHLRHDPRGNVGFAVMSPELGSKLGLSKQNCMYIFQSATLTLSVDEFNQRKDFELENIILPKMNEMTFKWTFPSLQKSFTLSEKLRNATLILFTPYEPDKSCRPIDNIMRRIVSLYGDCEKRSNFTQLIQADAHVAFHRSDESKSTEYCQKIIQDFDELFLVERRVKKANCLCLPGSTDRTFIKDFCWKSKSSGNLKLIQPGVNCSQNKSNKANKAVCSDGMGVDYHFSTCCYRNSLTQTTDPRRTMMEVENCRKKDRRCAPHLEVEREKLFDLTAIEGIQGLKCRTNRTLDFTAIDSELYPAFLEEMGIRRDPRKSAQMVIVDKKNEVRFAMDAEFTVGNVVAFIHNYTFGLLEASRRSGQPFDTTPNQTKCNSRMVRLDEVTLNNFQTKIHEDERDVVLLHYAPWCSFCKPAISIFYNLAAQFLDIKGITFKKIDTDKNELFWEDKLDFVPAVQIFPTSRKRDNVATFPANETLSLVNLLKFTLLHSSHQVWQQFVTEKCGAECWSANQLQAKKLMRTINRNLKRLRSSRAFDGNCDKRGLEWRIREAKRKLEMLQQFMLADGSTAFFNNILFRDEHSLHSTSSRYFLRAQILSSRFS